MDLLSTFGQRTFPVLSPPWDLFEIGLVDRIGMAAKRSQLSTAFSRLRLTILAYLLHLVKRRGCQGAGVVDKFEIDLIWFDPDWEGAEKGSCPWIPLPWVFTRKRD